MFFFVFDSFLVLHIFVSFSYNVTGQRCSRVCITFLLPFSSSSCSSFRFIYSICLAGALMPSLMCAGRSLYSPGFGRRWSRTDTRSFAPVFVHLWPYSCYLPLGTDGTRFMGTLLIVYHWYHRCLLFLGFRSLQLRAPFLVFSSFHWIGFEGRGEIYRCLRLRTHVWPFPSFRPPLYCYY